LLRTAPRKDLRKIFAFKFRDNAIASERRRNGQGNRRRKQSDFGFFQSANFLFRLLIIIIPLWGSIVKHLSTPDTAPAFAFWRAGKI
jgi:hypothetical protein